MNQYLVCWLMFRLQYLITVNLEIFARVLFWETTQIFKKIKPSQIGDTTLSITDEGKSCPSCELLMSQKCLLKLFVKIKLSRKFPNLQYLWMGRYTV